VGRGLTKVEKHCCKVNGKRTNCITAMVELGRKTARGQTVLPLWWSLEGKRQEDKRYYRYGGAWKENGKRTNGITAMVELGRKTARGQTVLPLWWSLEGKRGEKRRNRQDRQRTYNVTLKRVVLQFLQWKISITYSKCILVA